MLWVQAFGLVSGVMGGEPSTIERRKVTSTSIASIGFDPVKGLLEIEFRSGAVYRYRNVAKAVFDRFLEAESKGRFFTAEIRGKYRYERLSGPRE